VAIAYLAGAWNLGKKVSPTGRWVTATHIGIAAVVLIAAFIADRKGRAKRADKEREDQS
jgi:hypothetical protein